MFHKLSEAERLNVVRVAAVMLFCILVIAGFLISIAASGPRSTYALRVQETCALFLVVVGTFVTATGVVGIALSILNKKSLRAILASALAICTGLAMYSQGAIAVISIPLAAVVVVAHDHLARKSAIKDSEEA